MPQKIHTPDIKVCAICGAKAIIIDWDYDCNYRVYCDNNHTATKNCGSVHRAICKWNNAQAKITSSNNK